MDTGKILLGIALVVFSAALMVHPSSAMEDAAPLQVGSGSAVIAAASLSLAELPVIPGLTLWSGISVPAKASRMGCHEPL